MGGLFCTSVYFRGWCVLITLCPDHYVQNAEERVWLAVTLQSLISLSSLLFENNNFGCFRLLFYFRVYLHVRQHRLSNDRECSVTPTKITKTINMPL